MTTKNLLFVALNTYPGITNVGITKYCLEKFQTHFDHIYVLCLNQANKNEVIKKKNITFYAGSIPFWKKSLKTSALQTTTHVYVTDWFIGGYIGIKFAKKQNPNLPVTMRCGSPWNYTLNSPMKIIKSIIKSITKPYVVKNVDKIAYNSKAIVEKKIKHEYKVIRNPIDTELFKNTKQHINFPLKTTKANNTTFKVLFIGRICPEKGIEYLEKAHQTLLKDKSKTRVKLGIVGPGELPKTFKDLNQLTIHGKIPQKELPELINEYDCLILPSLNQSAESFPNVILEAMACEKPIIATDIAGIPEIITDNENGTLIKEKDHLAIVNAILKLKQLKETNPKQFQKIGKANRAKIIATCSKEFQLKKLYNYLFN